jgi:hypothetical protein
MAVEQKVYPSAAKSATKACAYRSAESAAPSKIKCNIEFFSSLLH